MRVNFPPDSKLTIIENDVFRDTRIDNFFLPPLVTKIGNNSFEYCACMQTFSISENSRLTTIWKEAFICTCIKKIYLSDYLIEFGDY